MTAARFRVVVMLFLLAACSHYADVMPQDVIGVVVLDTPAPSAEPTLKHPCC